MSDAPFSMPRRRRRWSFSRSIGRHSSREQAGARQTTLLPSYRPPPRRLDRRAPGRASARRRLHSREGAEARRSRGGALQRGRRRWRIAGLLAAAIAGAAGAADDPPAAPSVPLDRLFKLPDSSLGSPGGEQRHGGHTRSEWEARFRDAAAELASARKALADSRKKLEEIAPDKGWSMSAPGMPVSASEAPLDFKLRQEIRRQREDVEHAERRLDE